MVTGDVDLRVLDDLVRMCVQLERLEHAPPRTTSPDPDSPAPAPRTRPPRPRRRCSKPLSARPPTCCPGRVGWPSFLRTRQLGARLAGPSLPLDIGYAETIPAGIRNAVILRDRRCRWPGGCRQPAAACQVHHVKHKANGGPTSLKDCVCCAVPPPGRHPPVGLDPGPEPRRHHHRLEPRQNQSPAQPQTTRPAG